MGASGDAGLTPGKSGRGGLQASIDRVGRVRYAFSFTKGEEKLTVAATALKADITTGEGKRLRETGKPQNG